MRLQALAECVYVVVGTLTLADYRVESIDLKPAAKGKRADRYEPLIGALVQITHRICVDEPAAQ